MGFRDLGKIIDKQIAESVVSDWKDTAQETGLSIHVVNGPITGTLYLEASNSNREPGAVVSEVSFDALTGTADYQIMNITNCNSRYYRVGYTHSSGTGFLRVYMVAKDGDR